MDERRKLQRFDLQARTRIRPMGTEVRKPPLRLFTKDVSSAGAFVLTPTPLPEGVHVSMELFLPVKFLLARPRAQVSPKVIVEGKVIRAEDTGMAIAFQGGYRFAPVDVP